MHVSPGQVASGVPASERAAPAEAERGPTAPRVQPERPLGQRVRSLSLARLPERRSSGWRNAAWIGGALAALTVGWYAYTRFVGPPAEAETSAPRASVAAVRQEPPSPAPAEAPAARSESTTALKPSLGAAGRSDVVLEAKGYIVPAHQILVSPKVSGMIVQLNIEEGRRVTNGDVLAVLESTDYEAEVARAKATVRLMRERLRELENGNRPEEINEAEAELREAESQIPQLESEFKRAADLRRRNSIAQQDYEIAESKYLAQLQRVQRLRFAHRLKQLGPRPEQIEAARAELAQAEADLVKAEWRLGNCTIRAPVTGTILKKNAEEGNIVNPIAFNGSFSLCDMADLSDLEVDLNIQERDIAAVKVGQRCRVRAEAFPERIYEGYVDRLMPIADRAKGAIPVRVKIRVAPDEEGVYLKPEMGAIVTFLNQQADVPRGAPGPEPAAGRKPGGILR
jgi:multidrug resistance efflux pump